MPTQNMKLVFYSGNVVLPVKLNRVCVCVTSAKNVRLNPKILIELTVKSKTLKIKSSNCEEDNSLGCDKCYFKTDIRCYSC